MPLVDGDLIVYSATRFDFMLAHPETARLAAWLRLERHAHPSQCEIDSYRANVDAIAAAQREGRVIDGISAAGLFAMVLRLAESWLDAPLTTAIGADPRAPHRLA
ncbi:hypothetical protein ACIBCP_16325 [Streptomyces sp. NPDC051287]|uniref:hypothetical protein n=1 Tax=Streptomyces sp. NPDC051287 TaxID=3365648 RepID=UPI00379C4073